ncbi:MAG: hypothetical protein V1681_09415 [Candidatus Neomarinimicrobiota bacterium]
MKNLFILSFVLLFATFLCAADSPNANVLFNELALVAEQDTVQENTTKSDEKSLDEIVEDENWKKRLPLTDWDWNWEDKDVDKHEKGRKRGYFRGGAGGWDVYYLPLNLGDLNTEMGNIGLNNGFNNYMIMTGGGGWGYIGKSIRIGGLGAGGKVIAHGKPHEIQKEVTLSISFGGVTIDKVCHPFSRTELYLGIMAGGGNSTIDFVQHGSNVDWDQIITGYTPDTMATSQAFHDYRSTISTDYFTLMPNVGFRYNIFRWFAVGANVGYVYTLMDQEGWRMDHQRVENVPDLDFTNVIYRVNFYFGG